MKILVFHFMIFLSLTCGAEESAKQDPINARYLGLIDGVVEAKLDATELTNSLSALETIPDKLLTKARAELLLTAAVTQTIEHCKQRDQSEEKKPLQQLLYGVTLLIGRVGRTHPQWVIGGGGHANHLIIFYKETLVVLITYLLGPVVCCIGSC